MKYKIYLFPVIQHPLCASREKEKSELPGAMEIDASGSAERKNQNELPGTIQVAIEMAIKLAIEVAMEGDASGSGEGNKNMNYRGPSRYAVEVNGVQIDG